MAAAAAAAATAPPLPALPPLLAVRLRRRRALHRARHLLDDPLLHLLEASDAPLQLRAARRTRANLEGEARAPRVGREVSAVLADGVERVLQPAEQRHDLGALAVTVAAGGGCE